MLFLTSVYLAIRKLILLFSYSFHINCIILFNIYFSLHLPCFSFFLIDHNQKQVLLIKWVTFFFQAQKYFFALFNFLKIVILTTLFWRWSTLWNSTLKIRALFRRCITLSISMLKQTTLIWRCVQRCKFRRWHAQHCFNVDSILSDIPTSYHPNSNIEITLKGFLSIDECC